MMILYTFLALMIFCGILLWCCIRAGARADQQFDEAQISAACEGAMIRELSDIRFKDAAE